MKRARNKGGALGSLPNEFFSGDVAPVALNNKEAPRFGARLLMLRKWYWSLSGGRGQPRYGSLHGGRGPRPTARGPDTGFIQSRCHCIH